MRSRRLRLAGVATLVGTVLGLLVAVVLARKPRVELYDVAGEFDDMARLTDRVDQSTTYFNDDQASVHMHVMGLGQMYPLHIHKAGDEVTVIVSGTATVTQIHGEPAGLVTHQGRYTPGSVVISPRMCGHEWLNADRGRMLGNLVFSEPAFIGNFYLRPNDPLLEEGGAPVAVEPEQRLTALRSSGAPRALELLPALQGRIAMALMAEASDIPASVDGETVLYVLSGHGRLLSGSRHLPLAPAFLGVVPAQTPAHLEVEQGHPLAMLVFTPDGADRPALRSPEAR